MLVQYYNEKHTTETQIRGKYSEFSSSIEYIISNIFLVGLVPNSLSEIKDHHYILTSYQEAKDYFFSRAGRYC